VGREGADRKLQTSYDPPLQAEQEKPWARRNTSSISDGVEKYAKVGKEANFKID